jgi:hypothetical protein
MNHSLGEILIELHYLPSLEYMACLLRAKRVHIEMCGHYQKQSYRNRCHVLGANGLTKLIVPVEGSGKKIPEGKIRIDYRQKWQQQHWRTLQSAYGKSPFFEHYADFFEGIYSRPYERLYEWNRELLTICLKLLGQPCSLIETETYKKEPDNEILDMRSVIHSKEDYSHRSFYRPYSYPQLFGKDFAPNLSVLDLLFCEGPRSLRILQESMPTK